MAGAHITLDFDSSDVSQALVRLIRFGDDGRTEALLAIGEYLMDSHDARFAAQISPEGDPWEPLDPRYKKRKDRERPGAGILVFDNILRGGLRYQVENSELFFGTDRPYGAAQHFGTDDIPARPWLGLTAEDEEEALAILGDRLEKSLDGP